MKDMNNYVNMVLLITVKEIKNIFIINILYF